MAGDLSAEDEELQDLKGNQSETVHQICLHRQASFDGPYGELQEERNYKVVFQAVFTVLLVVSFISSKYVSFATFNHIIAIYMTLTIILLNTFVLFTIFSFNHLHFLRIRRRRLPNAHFVFIPYDFEEKEHIPIDAVSLFAALRGSNTADFIEGFFYFTFGLFFGPLCIKWMEYDYFDIHRDVPILLMLASSYGMFFANAWNLERKDVMISQIMHYISVMFCAICGPLALCLQQSWSALSILLMVGTYSFFTIYISAVKYVETKVDKLNHDQVHRYSLKLLIVELIGMTILYSTGIIFIYEM